MVQNSGFRVQGSGLRVQGSGFKIQGSGFMFRFEGLPMRGDGLLERAVEDKVGYGFGREFAYEIGCELGRDARHDGRECGRDTTPDPWKRSRKVSHPCKVAVFKRQERSPERSQSDLPPPAVWRGTGNSWKGGAFDACGREGGGG